MADQSASPPIHSSDIAALSRQLHDIDLRLQALTAGEIDAVIGPGGKSYLLQQAQAQLLRSDQEQRVLAKQLDIERSKLVAAQAVAKIGSWSFEVANCGIEWSDEMHRIWQTDPQNFHPTYEQILELIHPQDRAAVDSTFVDSLKHDGGLVLEHRLLLSGGVTKFVEERWQIECDERGHAVRALGTCQDISDRRQSEEALRQSQAQLRMASRLGRIGAWSLNLSQSRVLWSEETCLIHEEPAGTSPELERAIEYYAPEYREIIRRAASDCAEEGTPFDLELEILTARGRRVWVRAMGEAVRDSAGAIQMIQGAFQDLSDRKRGEQETRRLATRLTTTLESLTIGFYTTDRDWQFTFMNTEAERMLGRRREDLIGKSLWKEIPAMTGSEFEKGFRSALSESRSTLVESQLSPQAPWWRATAYPSEEGLAVHLRDISVERAEREMLKLLETSVARLNDMLVIVDAASFTRFGPVVQFVNDAFVRFTGYSREEIIGRTRKLLSGPDTNLTETARIVAALSRFEPVRAELINYKKSGEPYWVEMDVVPVAAHGGAYTHFVGVERDITERKNHEKALRQLNIELEERVRARTAELTVAREEAEEAARAKSVFLATMSHEIRTPMNGVLALIEVLSQTTLHPSQVEMIQIIHDSADSLLTIIDDILDFSKIEAGKLRIESAPMRLADSVTSVCGLLQSMARSKSVKLRVDIDPEMPENVTGDEHRLKQVLINLVGNAIKFSSAPERTGLVSVRAKLLSRQAHSVSVEIAVTDNGVGMDQETMDRLFKPFSQADESTTRRFGGTGLGLAISDMLVHLMGGEITVQSAPAQGATFRVRLPFQTLEATEVPVDKERRRPARSRILERAGSAEQEDTPGMRVAAPIHGHGRILIAEDNETNREVIQRQLALLGYTADMALDGREALQRWRSTDYALLLTDLRMPEMDGYALATAIRAEEDPARRTAIIALTANALPEEEVRCRDAGMDGYLVKPVRLPTLKAALDRWLLADVTSKVSASADSAAAQGGSPVDLSVLTALIGDDPTSMKTVLRKFRSTSDRIGEELAHAMATGLTPSVRELSHKLKSSALSIGARSLGELCAEIERIAIAGNEDLLTTLEPQFKERFEAVRTYLSTLEQ
jgi:PAS domain S-box-containing protein